MELSINYPLRLSDPHRKGGRLPYPMRMRRCYQIRQRRDENLSFLCIEEARDDDKTFRLIEESEI